MESLRTFAPIFFAYAAALADAIVIFASAYFSNVLYCLTALGYMPQLQSIASFGLVVALLVVGAGAQRGEYALQSYVRKKSGLATRAFGVWNLVFMVFLALGFATKTTSDFSRGATIVFYVAGYISLFLTRRILVDLAGFMLEKRVISPRRLVIVGFEDRMAELERSDFSLARGVDVVAMIALRDHQAYLADDLALAAAAVRVHRADDVCLAIPWSRHEVFESCFAAFLRTPAEIHLDAARLFDRFGEARIVELGPVSGLRLTRPRLTLIQRMEKRLFDIAFSGLALTALAPFLLRHRAHDPASTARDRRCSARRATASTRSRSASISSAPCGRWKTAPRSSRQARRPARHPARAYLAPRQHRRTAATHQRAQRRDVDRRPATACDGP